MATAVAGMWGCFGKVGYTFAPGILLVEFQCVASALSTFMSAIPENPRLTLILRDGFFGDAYSKEMMPHYLLPDPSKPSSFLLQQLSLLYNTILAMKAGSSKIRATTLTGEFLALMDEFFTTKKVTLPLVFVVNCWMKSVGRLQGDGGLGRNINMTIQHSWNLTDRLDRTLAKWVVLTADQEIHELLGAARAEIVESKKEWMLMRANPLMAGFMMLDYQFKYLHLANEALLVASRFRAFGQLYAALSDSKLIGNILFFDRILELYETTIFTPSRAATTHGSYLRVYLISSCMTAAAVDAMFKNAP